MTFEQAKALLDDLFSWKQGDYANSKIFKYTIGEKSFEISPVNLDFFGGECTLHIELIKQICQYFEDLCDKYNEKDLKDTYWITIQTNGTTFFNQEVNDFYHKYINRIDMSISTDGCKACHNACRKYVNGQGSYDDVEKAILAHNELMGHAPNTKLTISIENMQFLPAVVSTLSRLGYKSVRGSFDITHRLTKQESEQYYNYLIQAVDFIIDNKIEFCFSFFWPAENSIKIEDDQIICATSICGSNGSQIAMNYDGNLYFCAQLSEATLPKEKEVLLGNIFTGISADGIAWINKFRLPSRQMPNLCLDCPLKFLCEDCPALNILRTNDVSQASPNCGATIAEARAAIYFAERATETNYPYFKDIVEKILKYVKYDPKRKYFINEKGEPPICLKFM